MNRPGRHSVLLFAAAAAIAAGWSHTFIHMWGRWFPAWGQTHASLYDRLMTGETYYRHGPLVLTVSLALALSAWRRRHPLSPRALGEQPRIQPPSPREGLGEGARGDASPTAATADAGRDAGHGRHPCPSLPGPALLGYALLSSSLALHLVGTWLHVGFTSGFSLVGVILGGLLAVGGRPALGRYGPAAALLLFMVPLPLVWIAQLNFSLKMAAASMAAGLAGWATGLHTTLDGGRLILMGPAGLPETLSIESACSGLRSLIALMWFGAVLAVLCRLRGRWRWAMVALAAPTAVTCNVLRIAALIAAAQTWGVDAVAEDGPLHALAGLGAFAAAMGILLAFEQAVLAMIAGDAGSMETRRREGGKGREEEQDIERVARRGAGGCISAAGGFARFLWSRSSSRPSCSSRLRASVEHVGRPVHRVMSFMLSPTPVVALLAVTAGASLWLARPAEVMGAGDVAKAEPGAAWSAPAAVVLEGQTWRGRDLVISDSLRATLGTPNVLHRRFTPGRERGADRAVDLIVVHHARDRQAIHPPAVCLEAQGHRLTAQAQRTIEHPGRGRVTLHELITEHRGVRHVHLYAYRTAQGYTTSYLGQQMAAVLSDSPAALIRITATGPDAETLATQAAAALLP